MPKRSVALQSDKTQDALGDIGFGFISTLPARDGVLDDGFAASGAGNAVPLVDGITIRGRPA